VHGGWQAGLVLAQLVLLSLLAVLGLLTAQGLGRGLRLPAAQAAALQELVLLVAARAGLRAGRSGGGRVQRRVMRSDFCHCTLRAGALASDTVEATAR